MRLVYIQHIAHGYTHCVEQGAFVFKQKLIRSPRMPRWMWYDRTDFSVLPDLRKHHSIQLANPIFSQEWKPYQRPILKTFGLKSRRKSWHNHKVVARVIGANLSIQGSVLGNEHLEVDPTCVKVGRTRLSRNQAGQDSCEN